MLIQTLEKEYSVIKYNFSDENTEHYICLEGNKKYTVLRVKNRLWIQRAMEFLMQQMENNCFTDFTDCFMSGGFLHIAMKYTEGDSLQRKLQNEECSFMERMKIGKSILDKIMIQNMPDYFLQDCLRTDSIIVSPALEVDFRYELLKLNDYSRFQFRQVQGALWEVFGALFLTELKKKILPEIGDFCKQLKTGAYLNIMEIYEAYDRIYKAAGSMHAEETAMPQTWGFRAWDRLKKYIVPLKKICAVLLILIAFLFLVYSVRESMDEGGERKSFEQIGTLKIR